ncbi:MAG: TRAP transporter substrate-binding protein DctP [Geopsychrobacter sp.]|nr:TRAP transporter substrate-binding protein DctP [Geopsychrobacter sp.]
MAESGFRTFGDDAKGRERTLARGVRGRFHRSSEARVVTHDVIGWQAEHDGLGILLGDDQGGRGKGGCGISRDGVGGGRQGRDVLCAELLGDDETVRIVAQDQRAFEEVLIAHAERGGLEQLQELYGRYNLMAFPGGNGGQEMGFFSNKKATKMEDFKGMRVRTPGWYMDIMNSIGASVSPLPGGEVYLALERGVIDAAEFSAPAINYPMGFDDITKYVIEPGVHQPSVQCTIFFNKDAWNSLPADLQWIVKIAAKETQLWSTAWIENLNVQAINKFKEKIEFVRMDDKTLSAFAKKTKEYLETVKAKNPDVKKTLDSQEQFKKDFVTWREVRGGVAPWPIDDYIAGKHTQ